VATFSINDTQNMDLALKLACQGMHGVGANPMVGCVIEKAGRIIAQGYHQVFGEAHAEINALNQINHQADGATLYVTLEPCSHQGKTPSCAQAIIESGAKKVIIAMLDPNPLVSGKGVAMLKNAGIEVLTGLLDQQAQQLNRGFIKRMKTGLPFVTCKIAMSLDGKTSMQSGESKWITGESARVDVQKLRSKNQAILTGSGTILADNPAMTVRLQGLSHAPIRVVIDSGHLGDQGINTVLLEAGPGLIGAMIENNLIDEFIIYSAPILMGSHANSMAQLPFNKMTDKINLAIHDVRMIDEDMRITASIKP
jgi:diaminohydroxyphosphoribosylaminopyrimidine deaminase/5-amino-6-(5-phosphoribosylamino)uracil reductase